MPPYYVTDGYWLGGNLIITEYDILLDWKVDGRGKQTTHYSITTAAKG